MILPETCNSNGCYEYLNHNNDNDNYNYNNNISNNHRFIENVEIQPVLS